MSRQTEHAERVGLDGIEVRECTTIDEFEACVKMQRDVFGLADIDIAPRAYLIASRRAGGWTLGAFDAGELVGFVILMVAVRGNNELIGYSHRMAVAASYQNRGLGTRLKWAQRERALLEGKSYITWTWEPMAARNAHFNLNLLGATVRSYGVNFYGTNYGVPLEGAALSPVIDSDRLFADWDLSSARVTERARGRSTVPAGAPVRTIEIPPDWRALLASNRAAARREQLRVREEFMSAFASGLVCARFARDPAHPRYLLYESVAGDS